MVEPVMFRDGLCLIGSQRRRFAMKTPSRRSGRYGRVHFSVLILLINDANRKFAAVEYRTLFRLREWICHVRLHGNPTCFEGMTKIRLPSPPSIDALQVSTILTNSLARKQSRERRRRKRVPPSDVQSMR